MIRILASVLLLATCGLGMVEAIVLHGEKKKGRHNGFVAIADFVIILLLLWVSGALDWIN